MRDFFVRNCPSVFSIIKISSLFRALLVPSRAFRATTRFRRSGNLCSTTTTRSTMASTNNYMSFPKFLQSEDSSIISNHVVIGNEAGDADSIVSALTLAYVDSILRNDSKTHIVSIPRDDLPLRRETVLLLKLANIDTSRLHYLDDATLLLLLLQVDSTTTAQRDVTLVDHNRLSIHSSDWKVVEILDHHHDEGYHTDTVSDDRRQIAFDETTGKALVASTCTLVAERLFASPTKLKPPYPYELSLVLLGVILLDTINMNPNAGKGTERDQQAIDRLVRDTDWSLFFVDNENAALRLDENSKGRAAIDTNKLFDMLSESKYDVSFWNAVSVYDALRLDYKSFYGDDNNLVFGASSILVEMDPFLDKPQLYQSILRFMTERNLILLSVLSTRRTKDDDATQRELLLCGLENGVVEKMANYLLSNHEATSILQLEEKEHCYTNDSVLKIRQFRQGNSKASRKQVAPIMLQFFQQK